MAQPLKIPAGEYYSTQEAAKVIGRADSRIRQLIRGGELSAIKVGPRSYLIRAGELRRILSRRSA